MNKKTFIDILTKELSAKDIPEAEIKKYVDKYNVFLISVDDEEFENEFRSKSDVDEIVAMIADNFSLKNVSSEPQTEITSSRGSDNASDSGMDKTIVFDTEQTKRYFPDNEYEADEPVGGNDIPDDDNENRSKKASPDKKQKKRKKEKKQRPDIKASPTFIALFIVALPITLPLFLIFTAIVAVFYAVLIAIIAAFIACLLAAVAAGTASAMAGIINGAIKLISSTPIGVYEIGLGLIIGGVTMLISLAVYIITVKLLPKLFPLITKFAKFVYGKIADLYYYCKERCAN
ncbi:MAG: hypothetical protein IJT91_03190 [Clostridia bacterium]|nr:hypothetical protein [Clostridia bacterium]